MSLGCSTIKGFLGIVFSGALPAQRTPILIEILESSVSFFCDFINLFVW